MANEVPGDIVQHRDESVLSTLIVGQSGGPTAVINSSLVGVMREARAQGIKRVYGMRYGVRGLLLATSST